MAFETNSVESLILLGLIGLGLILLGGFMFLNNTATLNNLESTEGNVTHTGVGESPGTEPGSTPTYYPVIEYRYAVDGTEYTNSNYRLGSGRPTFSFRSDAEEVAERYGSAGEVTVHYEKSDPSNSFIKKERPLHPYGLMAFGLVTLLASLKMLAPYIRD